MLGKSKKRLSATGSWRAFIRDRERLPKALLLSGIGLLGGPYRFDLVPIKPRPHRLDEVTGAGSQDALLRTPLLVL
jgi:hypothetical protein